MPGHRRPSARLAALGLAVVLVVGACSGEVPDPGSSEDGAGTSSTASTTTTVPPTTVPPVPEADLAAVAVTAREVVDADEPVALVPRSGSDHLWLAEQGGRIRRIQVTKDRNRDGSIRRVSYRLDSTWLDLTGSTEADGEQGLLGITFSPDGRRFYAAFTDNDGALNVEEWTVADDRADTRSRRRILYLDVPAAERIGGGLAFGPDGFLYVGVGVGDGGAGGTTGGEPLRGAILRIDPDGATDEAPYGIPASNPFARSDGGPPEVWARGVADPQGFSFDRERDDLWVADVTDDGGRAVTWLPAALGGGRGADLGAGGVAPLFTATAEETAGCGVVGGFLYRGEAIPALRGAYVYGDRCTGEVRALAAAGDTVVAERALGITVPELAGFGEDADGELWALSGNGPVLRIEPAAAPAP